MEECEKLQDELKEIYRELMNDEQFKEFAYEFIGAEALAYYIDNIVEAETDVNTLKEWIDMAKKFLKK